VKHSDVGILIDKKNYAESSVILHFYTQGIGRQQFIFKGAKKKNKPLLPLGIYEISYIKRPESELGIVQELSRVSGINEIYEHPQKSLIAFFIAEILKTSLKQTHQDYSMFQFIREEIVALEVSQELYAFPVQFLAKFITYSGYMPQIEEEKGLFFDLNTGSLVSLESSSTVLLTPSQLSQLNSLFIGDQQNYFNEKEIIRKNLDLLIDYCVLHIPGFQIKTTREIIQDVLYS
jgi:DNA repair protein RecO